MMKNYFKSDPGRQFLLDFTQETQVVLTKLLLTLDPNSWCAVYPSLDLGFPHDLVRMAGGFPTGTLAAWRCSVPFIPVDTTVNVCTSSVFTLDTDITNDIEQPFFDKAIELIKKTSYELNFHRGNHFVSFSKSKLTGKSYLVIHSSAAEFKRQYNGLLPVEGNWFMDDIKIFQDGRRYIRYLVGHKVEKFVKIAHLLEDFNECRHDMFAEIIVNGTCKIISASHNHHFYMPTDQSVAMGSFVVDEGTEVPIFSYPGYPIFIFRTQFCHNSVVMLDNFKQKLLVPHGWGKTCNIVPTASIDYENKSYTLNGIKYKIESASSLRDHPDLTLRRFGVDPQDTDYYFNQISNFCKGEVIDTLEQIVSLNKSGVIRWK